MWLEGFCWTYMTRRVIRLWGNSCSLQVRCLLIDSPSHILVTGSEHTRIHADFNWLRSLRDVKNEWERRSFRTGESQSNFNHTDSTFLHKVLHEYESPKGSLVFVSVCFVVHLCNPDLARRGGGAAAGLGPRWLITIHLAAAVNIDSSRDFQFEPRDTSWNITKCVELRGDGGGGGGQVASPGREDPPPPPPSCGFTCLSVCFNATGSSSLISLSSYSLFLTPHLWPIRPDGPRPRLSSSLVSAPPHR